MSRLTDIERRAPMFHWLTISNYWQQIESFHNRIVAAKEGGQHAALWAGRDNVVAKAGEVAYAIATRQEDAINWKITKGNDGYIDFPDGTDVKSARFPLPNNEYHLLLTPGRPVRARRLVLALVDKRTQTAAIAGQISTTDFMRGHRIRNYGWGERWFMDWTELNPLDDDAILDNYRGKPTPWPRNEYLDAFFETSEGRRIKENLQRVREVK